MGNSKSPFNVSVLATFTCAILLGCGKPDRGGLPDVYPVQGTVTHGGKTLAKATVIFQLVDGTRSAIGETDEQGRFQLTTFRSNDGAVPGEYQIAVHQFSEKPSDYPIRKSEDDRTYVDFVPKSLLPVKFGKPETSGLKSVVQAGPNVIDIDLM